MSKRYNYGPLEPGLTPVDLYVAGYSICQHIDGQGWCWTRPNPFGGGTCYGGSHEQIEDTIADARWLMTARKEQQMLLGVEL